jgi:hypothetical protein
VRQFGRMGERLGMGIVAARSSQAKGRVVTNDYTLRFEGQSYRIARQGMTPGLRGSLVRVDGTGAVKFRDHYLPVVGCEAKPSGVATGAAKDKIDPPAPVKPKAKRASLGMKNFHLAGVYCELIKQACNVRNFRGLGPTSCLTHVGYYDATVPAPAS